MAKTVVGLMENVDDAQSVVRELVGSGIERGGIGFMANQKQPIPSSADLNESEGSSGDDAPSGALKGAGLGAMAGGLIGSLTDLGMPEQEAHYYADAVRRGGILVTVAAESDAQADVAAGIMRENRAVDIGQRADTQRKQPVRSKPYSGPERRRKAAVRWAGEERRQAA